jgi:transketolase
MRKQFVTTVESLLEKDTSTILLLGDIGVYGFKNAFQKFPARVYNIGILEQSTIGLASGLATIKFIPIVHTIAPFLVERAYEQLKLDFGYQKLGGNFVSVGASYDYAALGCTHHCPGDVSILKNIPGMEVVVPGTSEEFDTIFGQAYDDGRPTYFRLSEKENKISQKVSFGKAVIIKTGTKATVISVGPTLSAVTDACEGLDVTILYYTTVAPFDRETLAMNSASGKILIVEPFYSGTLIDEVVSSLKGRSFTFEMIGVPKEFLDHYGTPAEHDEATGLNAGNIKYKLSALIG